MLQTVIDIIAKNTYTNPSKLSADTLLNEDLQMDHIDRLNLQIPLENELRITIDGKSLDKFVTVGDIVDYAILKKSKHRIH